MLLAEPKVQLGELIVRERDALPGEAAPEHLRGHRVKIRREHLLEDGYVQLAALPADAMKGTVRVEFVSGLGLAEAGIDPSVGSKGDSYAAVCYLSQYGFSDRLSQAIAHGIGKADAQVQLVDLRATDPQELTALVGEAKAVVVPTWPTEPDGELQASIGTLLAALQPKQLVGVYDAFGGNDEPIDAVAEQLRNQGLKPAFEPLRIRQLPQGGDYQRCEESGTDLGQILTRKKSIEALRSIDANLDKALGRLTGGLYIVTASQGEGDARRSGAMVASWVAQASFRPPGLSVAVAKDRAIEALMQVGDSFVINVLRQDRYKPLMQHFLKRFPPGADRFEGVNVLHGAAEGGPVLTDALAYLSCRVEQRMEGPDHWIIYALVEQGNVADIDGRTAVHHRKTGNHY